MEKTKIVRITLDGDENVAIEKLVKKCESLGVNTKWYHRTKAKEAKKRQKQLNAKNKR